jgi:hypothetical protein
MPTAPISQEVLLAAIRTSQNEVKTLKNGLAEIQALLAKNASAPRWIEDIPGKRVQFFAVVDVTINANSTSRVEGSYSVSTDGPFICTGVAMFYQRTTGAYAGTWAPATTVEARMASLNPNLGFQNIFDQPVLGTFDVEFSESGADRNWQNTPFASALFAPAVGGVYVLPVAALFGRSALVIARVTPTVPQTEAGKVQIIFLGYKIVQGDSVQP